MKDAHEGIDKTVEGGGAAGYDEAALAMPDEYPELERPALRKIDKYCMPEVPCVTISKRFTQVGRKVKLFSGMWYSDIATFLGKFISGIIRNGSQDLNVYRLTQQVSDLG